MSERISVASHIVTPPRLTVWEWAQKHVDWSLENTYRAALPGRFNADLMPFFREPLGAFLDNTVKEIVCVKCSQCGASENLIVMPMRWAAACANKAMLYVGGQQEQSEQFFIDRIKLGMKVSAPTRALADRATERGMQYNIGACSMASTWAKSGQGIKGRPFDVVFGDELSSFPDVSVVDEMRKRLLTRPNGKLVILSAPDPKQKRPSKDDPIFIEYDQTDQRQWFFHHSKSGEWFVPKLGTPETVYGIKWDQKARRADGTWDLDAVQSSAYYVTESGLRIEESERLECMRAGEWRATNPNAPKFKRGYKITQVMVPFEGGSFGHLSRRFLECAHKGADSRRVYFYESWAEPIAEEIERATDEILLKRVANYRKGQRADEIEPWRETHGKLGGSVVVTVDVQKNELYWLARLWFNSGDSFLIDWGLTTLWDNVDAAVSKHVARIVIVDNSYEGRKLEVERESIERGYIPVFGRMLKDSRAIIRRKNTVQTRNGPVEMISYTFNPDETKGVLLRMQRGEEREKWHIYDNPEREYLLQVTSEELTNGEWVRKRRNHLWDCEHMSILGAVVIGAFQSACDLVEQ